MKMRKRFRAAGLLLLFLATALPAAQAAPGASTAPEVQAAPLDTPSPPVPGNAPATNGLTLQQALALAEANNPGLQLAAYQVSISRAALTTAPASAADLAPAVALYARMQYGVSLDEAAISPEVTGRQAQINYEQAVIQYYQARQQVRLGAVQAYVQWQRGVAMVAAQQKGLDRALAQQDQVQAALDAGSAARYDLLQTQAQVAGQQAALSGAQALESSAREALAQVIGRSLASDVSPADPLVAADQVVLEATADDLLARALQNRPDLRNSQMDLLARQLQTGLVTGGASALVQTQVAAVQYELTTNKARTEVQQALWAARASLSELKARETALGPAREAVRLAELRYQEGLATYFEVISASAGALQAEAARIQTAAELTTNLAKLAQAVGDL